MTIPELYELFIHNPMVTNMQKRRWHPVACMR